MIWIELRFFTSWVGKGIFNEKVIMLATEVFIHWLSKAFDLEYGVTKTRKQIPKCECGLWTHINWKIIDRILAHYI